MAITQKNGDILNAKCSIPPNYPVDTTRFSIEMKERNSCNCAIIQSLEESVNLRIPLMASNQDEGMILILKFAHSALLNTLEFEIAQILLCDKIISSFVVSSCGAVESTDCNEDNNTKSRLSSEVIVVQIEVHCLK